MKGFQKILITFVLAIVFDYEASATPIHGKVTDAGTGEAIIGASIYDSRSQVGVISDAEGNFHIEVTAFPSELKISYVGYEQRLIRLKGDDNDLVVSLKEEDHRLNEVVVVGYGTQRRQKLTGSVATLDQSILSNNVLPTADGLLAGSVAGVSVTGTGLPGAASKIRIRGGNSVSANNEPLYVIDGFIYYKEGGAIDTGERGTGIEGGVSPLLV